MLYVSNAFSAGMITFPSLVRFEEITPDEAKKLVANGKFVSAVGHQGTAEFLTTLLHYL